MVKSKKTGNGVNLEGGKVAGNPELPVLGVMPPKVPRMRSRSSAKHLKEYVEVLSKEQAFSSETPEDGACLFHSVA